MDFKTNFTYAWIAIGIITFFYLLFFKNAPYGRHTVKGWGPTVSNRFGWLLMESPAFFLFFYFVLTPPIELSQPVLIFVTLWFIHYFNRTFIFPFRIKTKGKEMPLAIALSGVAFNSVNTWLVGSYLNEFNSFYTYDWFYTPQFIIGLVVFIIGFTVNFSADHTLLTLRKPGETGYKIPKGVLFNRVSSPNLLGEITEWIGFFIMTWSIPTLTFAVWTIANLAPRILAHHKWYKEKFKDYPEERKAFGLF